MRLSARLPSTATGLALTLALSACSTTQPQGPVPIALLVKCRQALPAVRDGSAGEVAQAMAAWAAQYHDCAILHNGLVDALQ